MSTNVKGTQETFVLCITSDKQSSSGLPKIARAFHLEEGGGEGE